MSTKSKKTPMMNQGKLKKNIKKRKTRRRNKTRFLITSKITMQIAQIRTVDWQVKLSLIPFELGIIVWRLLYIFIC